MNKDDKIVTFFVLLIINISKHGAKEMGHIKMARPGFVPKKITNQQEPKPLFSLE